MGKKIQCAKNATVMLLCCFTLFTSAQVPTPSEVHVSISTVTNGAAKATCYVLLQDTLNIQTIQVQLGTNDGLSDLLNHNFSFDVSTGLPAGFSYTRNGNNLILEVGSFTDIPTLFGKVRIKDTNGQWSDYFKFIAN